MQIVPLCALTQDDSRAVAGYDADGNPISVEDANTHTTSSSFDLLGNLTGKTLPDGTLTETRGYDHAGNLTSLTHFNGKMTTYTYDNLNRLLSRVPDSTTGEPTVSFSYTSTGQRHTMTDASGTTTYGYDSLDRLTSKATPEGTLSYTYDSLNRLSTVVDNRLAGSNTTTNPTGYPQVVEELTSGVVTRTYTYGLQRISQYQIVNSTWTPSFYGYDGMGSVRTLTNAAGAITDSYDYDAFGNKLNVTGTTPNNYLYRGEQFDPDLGLYYLRARYYNPATGRFMSRDHNAGNIRIPATLHKYLYASDDPVDRIDPQGREDLEEYGNLICGGSGDCPALFPGLTAKKVIGGGLVVAVLARYLGEAFGLIGEELDRALGPDLHDPGKREPGYDPTPEEDPASSQ